MKKYTPPTGDLSFVGMKFLVVDDHKFIRQIVVDVLRSLDVGAIVEARDGDEAVRCIRSTADMVAQVLPQHAADHRLDVEDERFMGRGAFDCVITDFHMAPDNGLTLLKSLRTGESRAARNTPVIMLTGFADDYLISAALQLDVNAFVLKPISRKSLIAKLSRVLMRPIEPKSPEYYAGVSIPHDSVSNLSSTGTGSGGAARAKSGTRRPSRDMPLEAIPEGTEVARAISGPNGAALIPAGTRLTGFLLEKLRELHGMQIIGNVVAVYVDD